MNVTCSRSTRSSDASTDHGVGTEHEGDPVERERVAPAHVAEVRERQHVQKTVVWCGEVTHVARNRGHRVGVQRAPRAGRAARPDDARGSLDARRQTGLGSAPNASLSSVTGSTRPGSTPSGGVAPSPTTVTAGSVGHDARLFGRSEAQVDRRGDRPGARGAEVAGCELDRVRHHEAHHVARPDAGVERGGEAVGGGDRASGSRPACRRARRPRGSARRPRPHGGGRPAAASTSPRTLVDGRWPGVRGAD